jgi:copper transport protein
VGDISVYDKGLWRPGQRNCVQIGAWTGRHSFMRGFFCSRARVWALVLALVATMALALPGTCLAHANLRTAVPGDHTTVDEAPPSVHLEFSGPIALEPDAVQVFAPNGKRTDTGEPTRSADGAAVDQPFLAAGEGTYAVAWRVTSQDGHTVTGTLAFHVKQPSGGSAADKPPAALQREERLERNLKIGQGVARFFLLAAVLMIAGGGLFATVIAPGWRVRWLVPAVGVLLLALGAAFVLDAAIGRGVGVWHVLSASILSDELHRPFGRAALVIAALAVLSLGPITVVRGSDARPPSPAARWMMALVFAALASGVAFQGHAIVADQPVVRVSLDIVHLVAASIWLGGLVQLLAMAPTASHNTAAVERFSTVAFASVITLLVTGSYATWVELDADLHQLIVHPYGRIILAKLLLYFGTMPLAFLNKTLYVPAIARRPADASRLLRQYVARELFLLIVIVAITAWLIGSDQPR